MSRQGNTSPRPPVPRLPGRQALVCGECSADVDANRSLLAAAGWEPTVAPDLERARWLATVRTFGLVVVIGRSATWTRRTLCALRPLTTTPILLVARPCVGPVSAMLRAGADAVLDVDCVADVFAATAEALVRRLVTTAPTLRYLQSDDLQVDLWARRVTVAGHSVALTPTEFDILHLLMTHSQIMVKHHEIIKAVWSSKYADERNALRLQINRLRRKLADQATDGRDCISLVRGVGYSFNRSVVEFADVRGVSSGNALRVDADHLLESTLRRLISALVESGGRRGACAVLVDKAVEQRLCDGAAVFVPGPDHKSLELVVQAGMPAEWQHAVADGLPLDQQFVAADTFNNGRMHQYVDVAKAARRFRPTVRLLRTTQFPVQLSVPLTDQYGTWGQVGFVRRSDDPFTVAHSMALEAAAAVLGALFPDGSRVCSAVS